MRKVYYNNLFAHLLLWRKGFDTVMLFGFICTKRKKSEPLSAETVNHEIIHAEQCMEVTVLAILFAITLSIIFGLSAWPFVMAPAVYYIIYFVEMCVSWIHHFFAYREKDAGAAADKAYYNSLFEQEAHDNEGNPYYILTRKSFAWIKYFGKI